MINRRHRDRARHETGFSLVEVMVSIGLVAVMLALFSSVLSTVGALKRNDFRFQAANFVREEIDALHALPYDELIDQQDGSFLGLAFTRGDWKVMDEATAPSGDQVLELVEASPTAITQETGLLVSPTDYHDDFTFLAKVRTMTDSPLGWGTAIAFRYRDASNHYRFRLSSGGYALDRVLHGTVTTLWNQNATISKGSWYSLAITCSGTSIRLWSNGSELVNYTADSSFSSGDLALMSVNGSLLQADDLVISQGGELGGWDFDTYVPNELPIELQRFVYFDLPDGQGALTIEDYDGIPGMKQVTVDVSWTHLGVPQSVSGTTVIADAD